MEDRKAIETILNQAYESRQKQDLAATEKAFCSDACITLVGAPAPATEALQRRQTLEQLFDAFELLKFDVHYRVIEPPRAVVHWRGRFRSRKSGGVADTDVLDLFEIKDGKIASLSSFFDTALAARLMA